MEKNILQSIQLVVSILILVTLIYIGVQLNEIAAHLTDLILQGNVGVVFSILTWHI